MRRYRATLHGVFGVILLAILSFISGDSFTYLLSIVKLVKINLY